MTVGDVKFNPANEIKEDIIDIIDESNDIHETVYESFDNTITDTMVEAKIETKLTPTKTVFTQEDINRRLRALKKMNK